MFSLCLSTSFVLIFLWVFKLFWEYSRENWTFEIIKSLWNVPGPKGTPILGSIGQYRGTQQELWIKIRKRAQEFPKLYKIWALHYANVLIYSPEDMEKVMTSSKLITKGKVYDLVKPWLNTGLLTSDGEKWHNRRKLLTPAFHFNILREFVQVFEEHSFRMVEKFRPECNKEYTDVMPFVTEFALQTLCETTMGYKIEPGSQKFDEYKKAIHSYSTTVLHRIFRPWLFPEWIFWLTSHGRKIKRVLKILHKFTRDVIDERLQTWDKTKMTFFETASGKKRCAMLDLLIMQMQEGADIDYAGLCEEVDTFMFEGHDTSSTALAFFLFVLANHPEVQDKILDELRSIFGDSMRKASYEDIQSMLYLEMCIKESLRMFPPVHYISRQLTEDIVLQNYKMPAGICLHCMIYDLHFNPEIWPEPNKFIPERFTPENTAKRHPFAYVPFSAGYRNCIGQKFAIMEIKSFISKILWSYKLEPVATFDQLVMKIDIILRSENGSLVRFRPRNP